MAVLKELDLRFRYYERVLGFVLRNPTPLGGRLMEWALLRKLPFSSLINFPAMKIR